jgi:hypothetical protein
MFNSLALFGWLAFAQTFFAQLPCEKLTDLKLANVEITSAVSLPAGTVSSGTGNAPPIAMPARCIVKVIARPTSDSEIKVEVWLPAAKWNGRYMQTGNGGWAGAIPISSLANAIQRGYAAAGTNGGHDATGENGPAGWAIGHRVGPAGSGGSRSPRGTGALQAIRVPTSGSKALAHCPRMQ